MLCSQRSAHASWRWQGVGGSALMGNWWQCWCVGGGASALGCCWDDGGCATAGLLPCNVAGLLVLLRWWGGGIVMVLAQAHWFWRGGTCQRSAASTTMGPRPSSYATALMSADTCTGGLHLRPWPRWRPRPAQRRRCCGRHFSCSCWQSRHPCCCCHHHSHCHFCHSVALPTTAKKTMSWLLFLLTLAIAASLSSSSFSSLLSSL